MLQLILNVPKLPISNNFQLITIRISCHSNQGMLISSSFISTTNDHWSMAMVRNYCSLIFFYFCVYIVLSKYKILYLGASLWLIQKFHAHFSQNNLIRLEN